MAAPKIGSVRPHGVGEDSRLPVRPKAVVAATPVMAVLTMATTVAKLAGVAAILALVPWHDELLPEVIGRGGYRFRL